MALSIPGAGDLAGRVFVGRVVPLLPTHTTIRAVGPCSSPEDEMVAKIVRIGLLGICSPTLRDHGFSTAIRTAVIVKVPEKITFPETSYPSKLPEPL